MDVLVFAMFVQEFGSDAPAPNTRTAYLSYVDSVKLVRPQELRTQLFQGKRRVLGVWLQQNQSQLFARRVLLSAVVCTFAVLLTVVPCVCADLIDGYTASLKRRGFTQLLLWACPPTNGDEYVFHCHPPEQRVPSSKRCGVCDALQLNACACHRTVLVCLRVHGA